MRNTKPTGPSDSIARLRKSEGWNDKREIERLRGLLKRQYEADLALYRMPFDCSPEQDLAAINEHDAVHALLAAEFKA